MKRILLFITILFSTTVIKAQPFSTDYNWYQISPRQFIATQVLIGLLMNVPTRFNEKYVDRAFQYADAILARR